MIAGNARNEEKALVRIRVKKNVWKAVKTHAIQQDVTVETLVGQILESWLENRGDVKNARK